MGATAPNVVASTIFKLLKIYYFLIIVDNPFGYFNCIAWKGCSSLMISWNLGVLSSRFSFADKIAAFNHFKCRSRALLPAHNHRVQDILHNISFDPWLLYHLL